MKGKILVTARSFRKLEGPHQQMLRDAGYELVKTDNDRPMCARELAEAIPGMVGAILGLDEVTAEVLDRASALKVISRHGTGVDAIDLEAATARGVVVTNTPGANRASVAELAIALMLALARHIPYHDRVVKAGEWSRVPGIEVTGMTFGAVGMGHIGRETAERAFGLKMKIVYYDPVPPPPAFVESIGAEYRSLENLLSVSDVISLHLPLNEATRNLIDAEMLRLVKPSALLVNTSRGGVVDEQALYETLAGGRLAGAACDVFAQEPPAGSPLLALDNFVATPHLGLITKQTTLRVGRMAAENALAALRGERPASVVNPEVYEKEKP